MAALLRIPLLCVFAGLCSVACHSSSHRRHGAAEEQSSVWGDVDDHLSSSCCTRQQRIVQVGHGMLGYGVELDVGRCERTCSTSNLIERDSEEEGDSSVEQVCPADYACVASSSTLQRVSTRRGMEEVSVVEACSCREAPAACSRTDHVVLLYPGTPFETHLDVGQCAGRCHQGGCRPVRNRTVGVPGPAGSSCHSVVEECDCALSCYRVSSEETVYDYSDVENATGDAQPQLKVIDVGACVGSCSAGHSGAHKCLVRDHRNPGRCLAGLYNKHASCSPDAFRLHSYVTKERRAREILAITACKCG